MDNIIAILAFTPPKKANHTPIGVVTRGKDEVMRFGCTANTIRRCLNGVREDSFD